MARHKLHFAGYDFESGPGGTVINRPRVEIATLKSGDRVEYNDVNLRGEGTVESVCGKFCEVRWDRFASFTSREWIPNLKKIGL